MRIRLGGFLFVITGLGDEAAPLALTVSCVRCGARLVERTYPVERFAALTDDEIRDLLGDQVAREAEADARRGRAHRCGAQN